MTTYLHELDFAALRDLTGADCDGRGCGANAVGTGRMLLDGGSGCPMWLMEFSCPDCHSSFLKNTRRLDHLGERLLAANREKDRVQIIEDFVNGVRGSCHPWGR